MGKIDVAELAADRVGWTLLGTLYLRAWESRLEHPILGDRYAGPALERLACDPGWLHRRTRPEINQYLVALRARLLDDWSADFLARRPDAVVLHLGCGLDARMLRLDPPAPVRWIDLDLPPVMAVRRQLYPEREGYRMLTASVTDPGWWTEVPADRPVLVIAEGLFMYLPGEDVRRILNRVTEHAPEGEIVFDGVAPWLTRLSRAVPWGISDGQEVEGWNARLHCVEQVSITARYDLIPSRAVRTVYRLGHRLPLWRRMMQGFRFTFG